MKFHVEFKLPSNGIKKFLCKNLLNFKVMKTSYNVDF